MKTFETASFHIVKPCNLACKFCYATFDDMKVGKQLLAGEARIIIDKLYAAGVQKLTFAGGEPLLYKHIRLVIAYAKSIGMTTSIITNGTYLTEGFLDDMRDYLDWIGLSIDSWDPRTNEKIGRGAKGFAFYHNTLNSIYLRGYKMKINTVVNAYNKDEDFNVYIDKWQPSRWKVFQALRVEGQNDAAFDEVKVTDEEFNAFLERHKQQHSLVPESNEAMTGSYLLIDPKGRLFENSQGRHTYSDSLLEQDFAHCQNQLDFNRDMFVQRGGIYNW